MSKKIKSVCVYGIGGVGGYFVWQKNTISQFPQLQMCMEY